jgi:DNA-binding transcriptional regulator YhcF (GntR family)
MEERSKDEKEEKIILPPLPEDAIEFGNNILQSISEDTENKEDKDNILAEFVSDSEDETDLAEAILAEKDLIGEEPVIVDNPVPTLADPSKEFDVGSVQNALDDFNEEGGVRKAVISGPTLQEAKIIKTEDIKLGNNVSNFNPGTIQNALEDNKSEGGIVSNKTTGSMKTENGDSATDGRQIKESDKNKEELSYRVYGFNVQYKNKNSNGEIITVTKPISEYYDTLTQAMMTVNGSKHLMSLKNGACDVVDIVSGNAQISFKDQNIYTYTGGKVGMGGYWKRN